MWQLGEKDLSLWLFCPPLKFLSPGPPQFSCERGHTNSHQNMLFRKALSVGVLSQMLDFWLTAASVVVTQVLCARKRGSCRCQDVYKRLLLPGIVIIVSLLIMMTSYWCPLTQNSTGKIAMLELCFILYCSLLDLNFFLFPVMLQQTQGQLSSLGS